MGFALTDKNSSLPADRQVLKTLPERIAALQGKRLPRIAAGVSDERDQSC